MSKIIFDGDNVRAKVELSGNDDQSMIVVTFVNTALNPTKDNRGFGHDFLMERGISAVHVTVADNHWYQTPDMEPMLTAIRSITARYCRVVTYGSSMGGYGAAACSEALNAHRIVALNPQISVDGAKVPWETRWRTDAAHITFARDNMEGLLKKNAELVVAYDPTLAGDARHAKELLALSHKPMPLIVPFGNHPVTTLMKQGKVLSDVAVHLLTGDWSIAECRRLIRTARGKSSAYFACRGQQRSRRQHEAAVADLRKAIEMAPKQADYIARLGALYMRRRDYNAATLQFLTAIRMTPKVSSFYVQLGQCLLQAKNPAAARAILLEGARLNDRRADVWVSLFRSQFDLGLIDEARNSLRELRNTPGANPQVVKEFEEKLELAGQQPAA